MRLKLRGPWCGGGPRIVRGPQRDVGLGGAAVAQVEVQAHLRRVVRPRCRCRIALQKVLFEHLLGELRVAQHLKVLVAELLEGVLRRLDDVADLVDVEAVAARVLAQPLGLGVVHHEQNLLVAEHRQLNRLLDEAPLSLHISVLSWYLFIDFFDINCFSPHNSQR